MRREEIQAVLNGLWFEEQHEAEGGTYRIIASVTYTPKAQNGGAFAAFFGSREEPAQGGVLDALLEVRQLQHGAWMSCPTQLAPSAVIRRFADLKDEFKLWSDGGSWPRPRR